MTFLVHILAGALGIAAGAVALSAAKGANLHRKSGMVFVYAMLTMSLSGAAIAAWRGVEISVLAGFLAAYLVITALTTLRPPSGRSRWLDLGAMLTALVLGLTSVTLCLVALARGEVVRDGIPVPILLVFGGVALFAGAADFRMARSGGIGVRRRLARHLWRMCFSLFLATSSFFLGQADEFPETLRIPALPAVLALGPLAVMFYWLRRVRIRGVHRGALDVGLLGGTSP